MVSVAENQEITRAQEASLILVVELPQTVGLEVDSLLVDA
jgi:hypothetical protein